MPQADLGCHESHRLAEQRCDRIKRNIAAAFLKRSE